MIKLVNLLKEVLTEISIEQLKTQFVDSGKISQNSFDEITNVTPKTAYITWLAKKVADKFIKAEDIYKYKKYFSIFDRRKKEYPFADINQYKTQNDLSQFIGKSVEIADRESEDPSQQKGVSKTDKYKEFYIGSVDGFNVYKLPQGREDLYGASCELGSGTEWCTATGNTISLFSNYISQGPLFIFIKPGSNEKYQFHYESKSFMNKNDETVETNKEVYNLFKFIEDKEPQYKSFVAKFTNEPETLTPEDLNVKGDLAFSSPRIASLPDNLNVSGDIELLNTSITSLPDNLNIDGNLWLTSMMITTIPSSLKVGGYIRIENTEITSLPDNFKTNGDLSLHYALITSLPNNLDIGLDLSIYDTPLTTIPKNLKVNGNLTLVNTPISKKYTKEQLKQMLPGVKGDIKFS
jgi:hypothetical protein